MKILAVADHVDRALYEHFNKERWTKEGIDLIVSCGDLKQEYLDFLVSSFNVPCFYVRGNHDTTYAESPPGGCIDLHDHVRKFKGIRFFGLEGSRRYSGGPAQYTERQMYWMAFWARPLVHQAGGIDVLVTHSAPRICPLPEKQCLCVKPQDGSPPANLGQACYADPSRMCWELSDLPHRGFDTLREVVKRYQPRLYLHGHTHLGYGARPREMTVGKTRVIDCYGYSIVEV